MTARERGDFRRRWLIAGTASLLLHASLLLWWRSANMASGSGGDGGETGGSSGGFGPGSVIEVQIDVDAPHAAGATIPAEDIANNVSIEREPISVEATTEQTVAAESTSTTPAPASSISGMSTTATNSSGAGTGAGAGSGTGSGTGAGSGSGLDGLGAGIRTGSGGAGNAPGGTVPPRPIEITWPDTRKLAHCVGLRVDVRIRVSADGRVERVEPASTGIPDDCMRAALDTATRIKFAPGTVAGKPATLWSLVTIDFEKRN